MYKKKKLAFFLFVSNLLCFFWFSFDLKSINFNFERDERKINTSFLKKENAFIVGQKNEPETTLLLDSGNNNFSNEEDNLSPNYDNKPLKIVTGEVEYEIYEDDKGYSKLLRKLAKEHKIDLSRFDSYANVNVLGKTWRGEKGNIFINTNKNYFELTTEPIFSNFPAKKQNLFLKNKNIFYSKQDKVLAFELDNKNNHLEIFHLLDDSNNYFVDFQNLWEQAKDFENGYSETTDKSDRENYQNGFIYFDNINKKQIFLEHSSLNFDFNFEHWTGKEDNVYDKKYEGYKFIRLISVPKISIHKKSFNFKDQEVFFNLDNLMIYLPKRTNDDSDLGFYFNEADKNFFRLFSELKPETEKIINAKTKSLSIKKNQDEEITQLDFISSNGIFNFEIEAELTFEELVSIELEENKNTDFNYFYKCHFLIIPQITKQKNYLSLEESTIYYNLNDKVIAFLDDKNEQKLLFHLSMQDPFSKEIIRSLERDMKITSYSENISYFNTKENKESILYLSNLRFDLLFEWFVEDEEDSLVKAKDNDYKIVINFKIINFNIFSEDKNKENYLSFTPNAKLLTTEGLNLSYWKVTKFTDVKVVYRKLCYLLSDTLSIYDHADNLIGYYRVAWKSHGDYTWKEGSLSVLRGSGLLNLYDYRQQYVGSNKGLHITYFKNFYLCYKKDWANIFTYAFPIFWIPPFTIIF